ncbi:hypothetical protein [Archangium lansingense]|uniref:Uncharacterized protein n=1 Tax=Archangium lansingense TaxID=2995310 RepID=A0ABT4A066_9BACT|nr:hypothetical protein [Archangium lansinium]MCY1075062.1 hypothetical protein [Archangium lansinium]
MATSITASLAPGSTPGSPYTASTRKPSAGASAIRRSSAIGVTRKSKSSSNTFRVRSASLR